MNEVVQPTIDFVDYLYNHQLLTLAGLSTAVLWAYSREIGDAFSHLRRHLHAGQELRDRFGQKQYPNSLR